jgi:hypothetical protein
MPFHAALKQIRATQQIPSGAGCLEELPAQSGIVSHVYHAMHPNVSSVPKAKSGQYAHNLFSVADRRVSTPLLIRALNLAHSIVHHPVSQAVDCLLSVYIGEILH